MNIRSNSTCRHKKSKITSFYDSPPREEPIEAHPGGSIKTPFRTRKQGNPIWAQRGHSLKRGNPKSQENLGIVKPLDFFHELSIIENDLLKLINKLKDTQYINGIVNLSNYN